MHRGSVYMHIRKAPRIRAITHGCSSRSDTSAIRIRNVSVGRRHTYPMPASRGVLQDFSLAFPLPRLCFPRDRRFGLPFGPSREKLPMVVTKIWATTARSRLRARPRLLAGILSSPNGNFGILGPRGVGERLPAGNPAKCLPKCSRERRLIFDKRHVLRVDLLSNELLPLGEITIGKLVNIPG